MPAAKSRSKPRQVASTSSRTPTNGQDVHKAPKYATIDPTTNCAVGEGATLHELREEDKRKVANLIQQVQMQMLSTCWMQLACLWLTLPALFRLFSWGHE